MWVMSAIPVKVYIRLSQTLVGSHTSLACTNRFFVLNDNLPPVGDTHTRREEGVGPPLQLWPIMGLHRATHKPVSTPQMKNYKIKNTFQFRNSSKYKPSVQLTKSRNLASTISWELLLLLPFGDNSGFKIFCSIFDVIWFLSLYSKRKLAMPGCVRTTSTIWYNENMTVIWPSRLIDWP